MTCFYFYIYLKVLYIYALSLNLVIYYYKHNIQYKTYIHEYTLVLYDIRKTINSFKIKIFLFIKN